MTKDYLKLIYFFNIGVILFIFLVGKNISADQSATIIADEIKSNNRTGIVNAKGDVVIINHDGTKIKGDKVTYQKEKQKVISLTMS